MLDKIIAQLNRILILIGGFFLTAMIVLTCGNIFLRMVWVPISGTYELMGFFGAVTTAFALGYTQLKKGHIAVDILIRKFPKPVTQILTTINNILCALFFALISWQLAEKGTTLMKTGEVTETLRVIYYPFTYGTAAGCAFLALIFGADLLKSLIKTKENAQ
jgi:TRAP-type C4-dicarboxylate transport system permease small subunit